MPVIVPTQIAHRLAEIETKPKSIDPFKHASELNQLITQPSQLSDAERLGCQAEIWAWQFMPVRGSDGGPWQSYFGPLASGTSPDGKLVYMPDAAAVSREVIEYWQARSQQTHHPVLRARYSDLAIEIGQIWNRHNRAEMPIAFPLALIHRSIDSHLEALAKDFVERNHQAWEFLSRALSLALRIKDNERSASVKDAAFDFCRKLRQSGKDGYWSNLDNLLWDRSGLHITTEEQSELIEWLESALRVNANFDEPSRFNPHRALDAADHLGRWYKKTNQPQKSIDALKLAGSAFEKASVESDALVAIAWLEDLSKRYRQAKLLGDVARVDAMIKDRSRDLEKSMSTHEVAHSVSREDIDRWLDQLIKDSLEKSLGRISVQMMTNEDRLKGMITSAASDSPLHSMVSIKIQGVYGFTRSTIGPVEDDMAGRVINMASNLIGFQAPWLRMALERAKSQWSIDIDRLLDWLVHSPLFPEDVHELLREGLDAWFKADHLKAIHILTPQVESALREWLVLLGETPMRPDHDADGFKAVGMGEILHTKAFRENVDGTLRLHLRALYTDAKGLNLRNRIAHGLAGADFLGQDIADWVVHSLLAIRTYAHLRPSQ